jgi:hypothetical protein
MEKRTSYQKLLEQYIDQLGREERPAMPAHLDAFSSLSEANHPVKGVRLQASTSGNYILWLICGPPDQPDFVLRWGGLFRNRRLAEIMADYKLRQAVAGHTDSPTRQDSDDYHLSDWAN